IHSEITQRVTMREKVATSIDLPLSMECKRILAYSAEETERLNHRHIGTEHLLLGILREEKCVAEQILSDLGFKLNVIREELARNSLPPEHAHSESDPLPPDHAGPGFIPRPKQLFTTVHTAGLPKAAVVPDAETAKRIAEAVWTGQFGADTVASLQPIN